MIIKEWGLDCGKRWLGLIPLFEPQEGETVISPLGEARGYWVGGHSIIYDSKEKVFYLYYRIRNPRQRGSSNGRGFICRIARSDNGFQFEDIWEAKKNELGATSIERAALAITPEGSYRLYLSYESNEAEGWVIDVLEAAKPTEFQVEKRKNILRPFAPIARHLKDPYVVYLGGLWYMFFSYQTAESDGRIPTMQWL